MSNDLLVSCQQWFLNNDINLLTRVISTVVVLAIVQFLIYFFTRRAQTRLANKNSIWMQAFFYALRKPSAVALWVAGLVYSLLVATESPLEVYAGYFCQLVVLLCLIWFVLRMVNFGEAKYADSKYSRSKHQQETVRTVARLGKVIILIIGVILILQTLGFSVSGLVAFGGIGAAGIAFAAKDILGNFFGGIMVFMNKPFTVGDWIRSPDREVEGTVEHIGWLLTRIRTFDKRPLYVPNGIFTEILIENPQRMLNRRIKENIGVRYQDANKIPDITAAIKSMLQSHPDIDSKQTIIVDLVKFGDSSLDIMVYTFTKTTDWVSFQDIQQDVFLKIIDIIEQYDAECAFPTTTLLQGDHHHVPRNPEE